MENISQICSNEEHEKIKAILFCKECKIYMCNKCENYHSKLFKKHISYYLDKITNEIFMDYCQEKGHNNSPFEFFCKDHNKLCCASCICNIKEKGKGEHKDCNICVIEEIKDIKKNELKNNISNLENLNKIIEDTINKIKIISENITKKKEELKLEILNIFTKIRNLLNERETQLLFDIDKEFELYYFNENIIKENEKLPKKVKILLETGKKLENEMINNNNIDINSLINNCISIEQTIKQINILNEKVKNQEDSKPLVIEFLYQNEFNNIKDYIQKFGIIGPNILIKLDNSSIIKDNNLLIYGLENWKNKRCAELLYKKSRDGDSYDKFHQLCDKKGKTLTLIKSSEGFIIGGYSPLDWDSNSGWKKDNETFLFSITNKKIYKKIRNKESSIYGGKHVGPWFPYIGFRDSGKENMTQGEFLYASDICFENFND